METVLIVIHLMVVVALIGVVLLQRSEGGALGIGGGGGGGGLMSARGAANALDAFDCDIGSCFFCHFNRAWASLRRSTAAQAIFLIAFRPKVNLAQQGEGVLDLLGPNDGSTEESTEPAEPETPQIPSGQ